MYNKTDIMFLYAETSVHVGGGDSVGAIDLAIAREKYTDFPFIPSSGVKGAVRDWFDHNVDHKGEKVEVIFGPKNEGSEHAGAAVFTDARILLFPVRSLKGVFAWVTCPFVLNRLKRDYAMAGIKLEIANLPNLLTGQCAVSPTSECKLSGEKLVLEEYTFAVTSANLTGLTTLLKTFLPTGEEYDSFRNRIDTNLVVLSDDDFKEFVKTSTEVQTRIKIDSKTKTVKSGALFYQENLPSDSLMYSVVAAQKPFAKKTPEDLKTDDAVMKVLMNLSTNRIQLGGNESIGKGIFAIKFLGGN